VSAAPSDSRGRGSSLGTVVAVWRYPVKSMLGECLAACDVAERGVVGDRAFALQDVETGKIASAKSPRMWPNLLQFSAAYAHPPRPNAPLPPVHITLPDGKTVWTDDPRVEDVLSHATGRRVRLISETPAGATYEFYVAEGSDPTGRDGIYTEVENDPFHTGSLHDAAPIHVLTTASIEHLQSLHPAGRFDVERFRPNFVVEPLAGASGFVENNWLKRELRLGEARVRITFPTSRCVMTMLAQGDLPKDPAILRTLTRHNRLAVGRLGLLPCLGVVGVVRSPGAVRCGDRVSAPTD
jgi:uncharacterized protein YcbX